MCIKSNTLSVLKQLYDAIQPGCIFHDLQKKRILFDANASQSFGTVFQPNVSLLQA